MAEQVRYERIGPPRKLLRRTRRTTWRCRISHVPEERFHRADAIHVAAHAVVAFDFGIAIRRAVFDGRHRVFEAAWASLAYARDDASSEARIALERDCIAVQCGGRPVLHGDEIEAFLAGVRVPRAPNARLAYRRREAKERYCLSHDPRDRAPVERAIADATRRRR